MTYLIGPWPAPHRINPRHTPSRIARAHGANRSAAGVLVACLLVAALAACGSNATGNATPVSAHAMRHPIIVPTKSGHPDALYIPDPIRVRVGQSITWTNKDTDPHDVTSDNGLFYSEPIATGASWTWLPTRPGVYHYSCTLHPDMHGEIVVQS